MNNKDMPAQPLQGDNLEQWIDPTDTKKGTYDAVGFTKFEMVSKDALMALLSNPVMGDSSLHEDAPAWIKDMTESANEFALALIKSWEDME